ncbi:MAG: alpha-ribazole phosphatase family protein [Bacteroidetes bacterium]|nr:alpha-ribazole phosphatase family protein [Bacteroidota bacterium]
MDLFLIRHTTPLVDKGICYGQTDLDVTESFLSEAEVIRGVLPAAVDCVYSSPLQRCSKLARHLYPSLDLVFMPDLMELHCGEWEMQHWDEIPRDVIDPWMKDFVQVRIPGGESYIDLHARVNACFHGIAARGHRSAAIVAHGGVLRSILAGITGTPLKDSFGAFALHYGCVAKLSPDGGGWTYTMLSNISTPKEQHKPSQY